MLEKRVLVAVTGASGIIYAERLIEELLQSVDRVYLVASDVAYKVALSELKLKEEAFSLIKALRGDDLSQAYPTLKVFKNDDFFSPIASGSSVPTDMVIVPCSMGTVGRITYGVSSNLIERAADVVLKESKNLIVCPRETPLNQIHLKNMLSLHEAGAKIIPPMPAFYNKPKSIDDMVDFVVARILEALSISSNPLLKKWNKSKI